MSGENRRSVYRACHLCEAICGVRIEDTILVGEGPSRSLTESPRGLVALG